jgi:hypothetical protein
VPSFDSFEIVNQKSGLCLDVHGYDAKEGDNIMLYACDHHADQHWKKGPKNGAFTLVNDAGAYFDKGPMGLPGAYHTMCLDLGANNDGANVQLHRCDSGRAQTVRTMASGVSPSVSVGAHNGTLCLTPAGPCLQATWAASGATGAYAVSGAMSVTKLPLAGASMSYANVTGAVNLSTPADFALSVSATGIQATLPQVAGTFDFGSAKVDVGSGAGIEEAMKVAHGGHEAKFEIGEAEYHLQPDGFYEHIAIDGRPQLSLLGLKIKPPADLAKAFKGEAFLGIESHGPSFYVEGDCDIDLTKKNPAGVDTKVVSIEECQVGWFGTNKLDQQLSVPILARNAPLPAVGGALTTERPLIHAAVVLGGKKIKFEEVPYLKFDGMIALDPDKTATVTGFSDLSKAQAALQGSIQLGIGKFLTWNLAEASAIFDVDAKQVDVGVKLPVLEPFEKMGASWHIDAKGEVHGYGRFGASSDQLVLDFSDAKFWNFDLDECQGQVDFKTPSISMAGRIKLADNWVDVGGAATTSSFSLTSKSALNFDHHQLAGSSLTVGLHGVDVKGDVSVSGKTWSFDERLTTPRTIKSKAVTAKVNIPVINQPAKFRVWAQYTMGGDLSVIARLDERVGPFKADQTFDVDSHGRITLDVFGQHPKIKLW